MPDAGWFRTHVLEEILPRWLAASATPQGAFLPRLDRQWRPLPSQVVTLVSQSRLLYNFAQGWRLTGEEAYRAAVAAGARFLLDHLRDPAHGGWVWSCTPEGQVLDARKDTYGHAFALFGLAHAFAATGRPEFLDAARHTWEILDGRLRDTHGGFVQRAGPDFTQPAEERSVNPLMHLFEALLAAGDLDGQAHFHHEAERVGEFIVRLVRPEDGMLPELYASDWRAVSAAEGGYLNLGHAFEWAYLLSAGVERGLPADFLAPARRFLDGGLRLGQDQDGGIHTAAGPDGVTRLAGKGNWQQCEAIRALLHFAVVRGRADLCSPLERLLAFTRAHFLDPEQGGWFEALDPSGVPTRTGKGHEWKVDYHVVGMCTEALRLLEG